MNIIGIAGGSGVGKSTLAYGLQEKYPERIEIVHFDDYQKNSEDIELLHGMKNWDHPNAIDFDRLVLDLETLRSGKDVTIMTKSKKLNPSYEENGRIEHTMQPKPILLVEGYMALVDERVRNFFDASFFLSLSDEERSKRRDKVVDAEYEVYRKKILLPMHHAYVEPSKEYATKTIDVGSHTASDVLNIVTNILLEDNLI